MGASRLGGVSRTVTSDPLERSLKRLLGAPELELDFVPGPEADEAVPQPARRLFRGRRRKSEPGEIVLFSRTVVSVTSGHRTRNTSAVLFGPPQDGGLRALRLAWYPT